MSEDRKYGKEEEKLKKSDEKIFLWVLLSLSLSSFLFHFFLRFYNMPLRFLSFFVFFFLFNYLFIFDSSFIFFSFFFFFFLNFFFLFFLPLCCRGEEIPLREGSGNGSGSGGSSHRLLHGTDKDESPWRTSSTNKRLVIALAVTGIVVIIAVIIVLATVATRE